MGTKNPREDVEILAKWDEKKGSLRGWRAILRRDHDNMPNSLQNRENFEALLQMVFEGGAISQYSVVRYSLYGLFLRHDRGKAWDDCDHLCHSCVADSVLLLLRVRAWGIFARQWGNLQCVGDR